MRVLVSFLIGEKECLGLFVVWCNVGNASCHASKPCWNKPLLGMSLQLVEILHYSYAMQNEFPRLI